MKSAAVRGSSFGWSVRQWQNRGVWFYHYIESKKDAIGAYRHK